MGLERLVYESVATGSTGSESDFAGILSDSQRNNDRTGLSGVLAAHGDRYVQVVEGPREALDDLLRRLEDDPRHRDVRLLDRYPATERMFEGWSMAEARVTPKLESLLQTLTETELPSSTWLVLALREAMVAPEPRSFEDYSEG